jgi:undecaprenyl-diphosphatase
VCWDERRGPESNRRIGVLQTPALPLGYRAGKPKLFQHQHFLKQMTDSVRPIPPPPDASAPIAGADDRRASVDTRGRLHLFWDLLFGALRAVAVVGRNFYATVGIFLVGGAAVALAGTYAFAKFAGHVRSGSTQAFDDAALRWLGSHRSAVLEPIMLEITFLGTGTVVLMIVAVSALFLWLTKHRYSAVLLLVSTGGAIALNNLLKVGFGRPRPQVVEWGTNAMSWSFPSGHAMSAAVVYGTVAYLAARLQERPIQRVITMLVAFIIIVLIGLSRLYLGVHYPSDVLAGVIIGLAWAGFCMATLEAIQVYARRRAPGVTTEQRTDTGDREESRV